MLKSEKSKNVERLFLRPNVQRVTISSKDKPFDLSLDTKPKHNLEIVEPKTFGAGTSLEAQAFIRTLLLAHLIARHLPQQIDTNFPVWSSEIFEGLYAHYGYPPPRITKIDPQISPGKIEGNGYFPEIENASASSGGADSAFRITDIIARGQGVVAIHIQNLNKSPHAEAEASELQALSWGIPYRKVRLRNSSGNSGYATMTTRDLLIGGLCAVAATPYRAKRVLIEGPMIKNPKGCDYSEFEGAWVLFNRSLKNAGLEVQVFAPDQGEIETIGQLLDIERRTNLKIIPLIQNCFSGVYELKNNRGSWESKARMLSEASPPQWCGSCYKCRRVSLGRIFFKDPRLANVPDEEKKFFVRDTFRWLDQYPNGARLASGSFIAHLRLLANSLGIAWGCKF